MANDAEEFSYESIEGPYEITYSYREGIWEFQSARYLPPKLNRWFDRDQDIRNDRRNLIDDFLYNPFRE